MEESAVILLQLLAAVILIGGFQFVAARRLALSTEAKRRWQHGITGHTLVLVSYVLPLQVCISALSVSVAVLYYLRVYHAELFLKHMGPLLRPDEQTSSTLPGAFYFLLGTTVTASLFPIQSARYAVDCLSLADPMAAWIGQSVPSPSLTTRATLAGSLTCFSTAWMIGGWYLSSYTTMAAGAVACTVAEALPFGNDNLLIPIVTAAAIELMQR